MPADYEELVRECTSAADLDSRAGEPCGKALRKAATAISELLARAEAAEQRCKELEDKVEGLEADLDNAVEVAFKRGATNWTRLNYPSIYTRLTFHA